MADLIDPRQAFILASVPQDRVPDVQLHARARFKLSGEQTELTGTVVSIGGDMSGDNRKLATLPRREADRPVLMVKVQPDQVWMTASVSGEPPGLSSQPKPATQSQIGSHHSFNCFEEKEAESIGDSEWLIS